MFFTVDREWLQVDAFRLSLHRPPPVLFPLLGQTASSLVRVYHVRTRGCTIHFCRGNRMMVVVSTKFVTFWTFFIRRLTGQAADAVLARFPRASTYVLVELDEKATASSQKYVLFPDGASPSPTISPSCSHYPSSPSPLDNEILEGL